MSELKLPRLLAAAKEFNIGKDTLIEFLAGKGFNREELIPTAKLTESMYRALQQEFQSDKVAKNKADQIEIPKGGAQSDKKKKEEEAARQEKEEKKQQQAAAQQPVIEVKVEPQTEPEKSPVETPSAPIAEVENVREKKVEESVVSEAPASGIESKKTEKEIVETPEVRSDETSHKETKPAEQPDTASQQEEESEPSKIKFKAPELEGPKVINKIDLSAIDSSTRPKKSVRKKDKAPSVKAEIEPVQKKEKEITQVQEPTEVHSAEKNIVAASSDQPKETLSSPQEQTPAETVKQVSTVEAKTIIADKPEETKPEESGANSPLIENIRAERIEGPKVLGKIELPVDSDTRPKPASRDEKRKRKRIPIDKKAGEGQQRSGQNNQQQGNRGGGGQQQGNRGGQQQGNRGGQQYSNQNQQRPRPQGQGGQQHGGGNRNTNDRNRNNRPHDSRFHRGEPRQDKEIDQKEIQEKIRQTQAKLAGAGGRGKSLKAKYRRAKKEEAAESAGINTENNKLQVTEFVTVSELANLMDVSFTEVISKCMGLGIMVSINQRLDAEVIELVAGEFGFEVEFMGIDDVEMEEDVVVEDPDKLQPRSPIVTIMGHVDHGKTSLLDYIRNANVVAGEAGGITQHIGAYEVTLANGKKITFLDTPGHEAFTAMRARGAKITDIAVIVVAADDAVMPQTKEAISHAQAAGVPMIFAVNKIDKDGANPQKIYEQLSQMNILVEEWGGKFQSQELSAKKGINVDVLLEKILLESELLDLKANPDKEATGTIIEASLDKGRGYVASVLVESGTLQQGDLLVSGQHFGKVKAMFNERNQRVTSAGPASPVQILGLNGAPQAGEKFKVYTDEAEAKDVANKRAQIMREQGLRARKHITLDEIGRRLALGNFKELNVIIKGDVDGSVEALSDSLQKLSTEEIAIRVVHKAVGQISESDVLLATASDAVIVGFNVRPSVQAARLAENEGVEIKTYSIIYNAIEEIKSAMEGMLEPKFQEKITANVEVREVYHFDKAIVAGCYVLDGKISRNSKIRIIRDGIVVFPKGEGQSGELGSLKRFKDDVKDVNTNFECGLTIKNFNDLKVGDIVEAFEEEEIKRTL